MTLATVTADPSDAHLAVLHRGPDDLADHVGPAVAAGLARGEAVLVCLDRAAWGALAARLGARASEVTAIDPGERYATPGGAMTMVHRFATAALEAGARAAWSVGRIPFEGSAADQRWVRYEAAVDDVLGHLPVRLVCAYDAAGPDRLLDAARRTHGLVLDAGCTHGPSGQVRDGHGGGVDLRADQLVPRPSVPPTVDAQVQLPVAARRLVQAAATPAVGPGRLQDVLLVTTELVTNALRHGRPPVRFRAWVLADETVVEVQDRGPGIADPYADLRPRERPGAGGNGLWIVGQLADSFASAREGATTVVRAALRHDG